MKPDFSKIKLLVLDFDGVMTDNKVLVNEDGKESVVCSRSDGLGIEMLKKKTGISILVLSKEENKVVQARCDKLKIACIQGTDDKHTLFLREVNKRKIQMKEVCFIGNDINDIDCIKAAGIGVAVNDAYPKVKAVADYVTRKNGGDGAVREIIDLIIKELS